MLIGSVSLTLTLILSVGSYGPLRLKGLVAFDYALQDRLIEFLPKMPPLDNVVLLGIDEASLQVREEDPEVVRASRPLSLMAENWPWSRELWGHAAERLIDAGARVVVIDLLLANAREGDAVFQDLLQRYPDRVVLSSKFDTRGQSQTVGSAAVMVFPSPSILPENGVADDAVGFVNFWPDYDGVIRTTTWQTTLNEVNHAKSHPDELVFSSMSAVTCDLLGRKDALPTQSSIYQMRWVKGIEAAYPTHSLYNVFWPSLWERNYRNGKFFKDKIVFIGPMAAQFQDQHLTAVGLISGPHLHLNAITSALQGGYFLRVPRDLNLVVSLLLGLLGIALTGRLHRPLWVLLGLVGGTVLFCAGGAALFITMDRLIGMSGPLGAFAGTLAIGFSIDSVRGWKEKQRLRRALEQRMPKGVVAEILENPDSYYTRLGGSRQAVTILFSDIRGFTSLTEGISPDALVEQLNEYLDAMVHVIFQNQGMIDKFIGDAIMAVWGNVTPMTPEESSRLACRAAQQMNRELEKLNREWRKRGKHEFDTGIGIHHGEAITGNIGSEEKMELTVIGDAVNLCARLESLTKQYGVATVISEAVVTRLETKNAVRILDRVRVVGKSQAITVFELITADSSEIEIAWRRRLDTGFENFFARDFDAAQSVFQACLDEQPEDTALPKIIERCQRHRKSPPPADWDGAKTLDKK